MKTHSHNNNNMVHEGTLKVVSEAGHYRVKSFKSSHTFNSR